MLLKTLKRNKITRTLLRYLAEVIIIFVGITISFLFEQWREEKQRMKESVELAQSLLADVAALKIKLQDDLSGSAAWIRQLDSLRIQRTSNKFSDRQLNFFYRMVTGQIIFLFDPYSPTYMSAAGDGSLNELPEHIKNKLYQLYRIELPFFKLLYEQQQENIINFRNASVVPVNAYLYSTDAAQISPDLTLLAREIQRPAYGNFINQVIITEKEVYKLNEAAFNTLKELEKSLLEFVEKNKK